MRAFAFVVIGALASFFSNTLWAQRTVALASTEYPPYYGEALANGGPLTEIVVQAFDRAGYSATVRFYPWARALSLGKQGQVDGISGIWHSLEREQWFDFSSPLMDNEVVLMKRHGELPERFTNFAALQGFSLGTVRGYANPPALAEANLKIDEVTEDIQNLRKLTQGRVDLILIDKGVARHLIQTRLPELAGTVEPLEPPVERIPLYLATSNRVPGHEERLREFNRGLVALRDSGQLAKILSDHGFTAP